MRKYAIAIAAILLLASWMWADNIGKALKYYRKKDYPKMLQIIQKDLQENPINPAAHFLYGIYYYTDSTQQHNNDSAYYHFKASLRDFKDFPKPEKVAKEYKRVSASYDSVQLLTTYLEYTAYQKAQAICTLEAYEFFIGFYADASLIPEAIDIRDSLAFEKAKEQDSYEAFKDFLMRYPNSKQAKDAQRFYDLFVFESETKEQTLESYELFLKKYPYSKAREEAEKHIFDITTTIHTIEAYEYFIRRFPKSNVVSQALEWLRYFYDAEDRLDEFLKKHPQYIHKNYLEQLIPLEKMPYMPIYLNDKFGYTDSKGTIRIPCEYDSIPQDYICENIKKSWVKFIKNDKLGITDKLGKVIFSAQFDEIEEFNMGVLLVKKKEKYGLVHQSGFWILPASYQEIEKLNDSFVKIKKNDKWGLTTYHHKQIEPCKYDDIQVSGNDFVIFQKDSLFGFLDKSKLIQKVEGNKRIIVRCSYEQIEWIRSYFIKVASKGKFGVLDRALRTVLPVSFSHIEITDNGWITEIEDTCFVYRSTGTLMFEAAFERFNHNDKFIGAKKNKKWGLLDWKGETIKPFKYDSIAFLRDVILLYEKNQIWAEFPNGKKVSFQPFADAKVERGKNETNRYFILVENKLGKKGLYNHLGKQVLLPQYDNIYVLANNLINVQVKDYYGLTDNEGKTVLKMEYDGIGDMTYGYVPLLKKGKFGLFHPQTKTLIATDFDQLPQPFVNTQKPNLLIASKEYQKGIIDITGKEILPFKYEEIHFWSDTSALVKKDTKWQIKYLTLPDSLGQSPVFDNVTFIKKNEFAEKEDEILIQGRSGDISGIFSNKAGQIVPMRYKYIQNIGDANNPLFLCEKTFEIGDIETISTVYYDRNGNLLKKRMFKERELAQTQCVDDNNDE